MPKFNFQTVFPEYANLKYWEYYNLPEYSVFKYIIDDCVNSIERLTNLKILISAPNTFYAKDIFPEGCAKGGIMNGFRYSRLIKPTGNQIKYYIDDPDGKSAIIGYAKEWELRIPKEEMEKYYNRIRNAILEII